MSKVGRRYFVGLQAVFMVAVVSLPAVAWQTQPSPRSVGEERFAQAAEITFQKGAQAKLPPHLSTLLGLSKEIECSFMQGVVRTGSQVQGFSVSVTNKRDIVLFVVDEKANDQSLYLTSPEGSLRRVVAVKAGVGDTVRITDKEREAFEKEKEFWVDRLVPPGAAK